MLVENSHSSSSSDALTEAYATVDGLMAAGKFAKSLGVMLPHVQNGELDEGLLQRTADCFFEMKDFENAINVMRHIVEGQPEGGADWGKLGLMLQSAGKIEDAAEAFDMVLKADPNSIPALTALNGLNTFDVNSPYARRLLALAEREDLETRHQALILHALGQIAHAAGETDAAMSLFMAGRAETVGSFVPGIFDEMTEEQISLYKPVEAVEGVDAGPQIIFVGGMPASGTGLVDRILSRHSGVISVGETTALSRTHGALRMHLAKTGRACSYWDWVGTLSAEEIDIFRQFYLERALGGLSAEGKVIVDTHPMGCLEFALAQVLFPQAKFVFLSRSPMDTALANIASNALNGNALAAKQEWIAQVMTTVYRSAEDYSEKLGDAMRIQSYDALVSSPTKQIAALLTHVGLEFEAGCLNPAPLCDLSAIGNSLGREELSEDTQNQWQPYASHLAPLLEALGGDEWVANWTKLDTAAR